jgi:hypothetical protein
MRHPLKLPVVLKATSAAFPITVLAGAEQQKQQ